MAELRLEDDSQACCVPAEQESCCDTRVKDDCCGNGDRCGCSAGESPNQEIREQRVPPRS
jgi:hypothetical protein